MAFPAQENLTKTAIGIINHFFDDLDGTDQNRRVLYNLQVLDQNAEVMRVKSGDETQALTAQQISQMNSFMANRRAAFPTLFSFGAGNVAGRCTWHLKDTDGITYTFRIRCIEQTSGGVFVAKHKADEVSNLTGPQVAAIEAFIAAQRSRAITEILG